jgi:hypothetical protein
MLPKIAELAMPHAGHAVRPMGRQSTKFILLWNNY